TPGCRLLTHLPHWQARLATERSGTSVGEIASLRLDVGCLDHLAPLFRLIRDELAELDGRHRHWNDAYVGQPCYHLGIGESRVCLVVKPVDDLGGCVFGRADPIPSARLVTRYEFTHCR